MSDRRSAAAGRAHCVTDRRRYQLSLDQLIDRIVSATAAGADVVQIRERDLPDAQLAALVRKVVAALASSGARVLVNDRVDVAIAAGAAGVHLPEHGLDVEDARALTKLPIGCSRHSVAAALACEADVIQLGPIFETPGKRPIGLEPLGQIGRKRLVAVGGIDSEERASLAVAAGADAVAVIRAAWASPDPVAAVRALIAGVDGGLASR